MNSRKNAENVVKNISVLTKLYPEHERTRVVVPIRRYESPADKLGSPLAQKGLIISGTVLGVFMGIFFGCVHAAETATQKQEIPDVDADADLERDNASQSGQEATRDQTEVSSSVRDQHHTLSIFRQFDPPV